MVRWYHWTSGHESEQTPGDGEGQGSLRAAVHGVVTDQQQLTPSKQAGTWPGRQGKSRAHENGSLGASCLCRFPVWKVLGSIFHWGSWATCILRVLSLLCLIISINCSNYIPSNFSIDALFQGISQEVMASVQNRILSERRFQEGRFHFRQNNIYTK